jgi:VanZ family protein
MNRKFIKYKLPIIAWASFIFLLCSTPGNKIPHISWLELLSFDKFVHAAVFFILNHFSIRALSMPSKFKILCITILCISYGGMLEIMQSYLFEKRSGDLIDFTANTLGCVIAVFTFQKVKTKIQKLYNKSY